jgi:hypothetical protein
MTQTVATQRGTTSMTSGGSSTLFTQSGGLNTRVIFNMMTFFLDGSGSAVAITITHTSSAGGSGVIGYLYANSTKNGCFFPANNAVSGVQTVMNSTTAFALQGIITGGTGYIGATAANSVSLLAGSQGLTPNASYLPSNYYIGPSDTISVRMYDANGNSGTFAYSITTITES